MDFTLNLVKIWKKNISKKPWFEMNTDGKTDSDGRVALNMDWNKPYIDELRKMGFSGHNEEEIVQAYMSALTKSMADPYQEEGDEPPVSTVHPQLSNGNNSFRS